MTLTGLQQIIDVSLDATRPTLTEIQVHSEQQTLGTFVAQELLLPSVETVLDIASDTLQGVYHGATVTFAFSGAGRLVGCRRDTSGEILCFDGGFALDPIPADVA
jgi:hypothetical protein